MYMVIRRRKIFFGIVISFLLLCNYVLKKEKDIVVENMVKGCKCIIIFGILMV